MSTHNTYDFDTLVDRRGSHSQKWDKYKDQDILPLWVADTDFRVAPVIQDALAKRLEHGVFGYTVVDRPRNQIVADYYAKTYGVEVEPDWIGSWYCC